MWNFSFILPSFFILVIFLGYYFFLPRMPLRKNYTFLKLLLVEFAVIILDVISTWVDIQYKGHSYFTLYFFNLLFFILFFVRTYLYYSYTTCLVNSYRLNHSFLKYIGMIPAFVCCIIAISSVFTGLLFYIDETGYHHGPLRLILYINLFIYIFFSVILALIKKDSFQRKHELWAALGYNVCLLVGAICRLIFPNFLLMDTFCIMAIIIIYLTFENPELYIEQHVDIFNSLALIDYLNEFPKYKDYKILAVMIHNYNDMREIYGAIQMDKGLYLIGKFLSRLVSRTKVFYYRKGRFIIITSPQADTKKLINQINERFTDPWTSKDTELYLEVNFVQLENITHKESTDLILNTIANALDKNDITNKHDCLYIGDKEIIENEKIFNIKQNIETAIENEAVEVYLQPIVDSQTYKIAGAEALARIRNTKGEIIMPSDFIPIAEKNGDINKIGKLIFDKTCQIIQEHDLQNSCLKWINVNLSPTQFIMTDLAKEYGAIIDKYGVDASFIHLEITEESLVDYTVLTKQISLLRDIGFQFVLDDYGKGYSNLIRLKKCPFINIKLDMELVWDYCKDPEEIFPNIMQAFKIVYFSVTAEGIEDDYMAAVMRQIGCTYMQGNYFSKALPVPKFLDYLEANK
ncbi:MAG: EAL domain-containing protein [Butyrivibrio sp.]|nr:EAL domain-containing protein [Butyrivibrio sp.]